MRTFLYKAFLFLWLVFFIPFHIGIYAQCSQSGEVVKYRTMAQAGINIASCNECAALALFTCEMKACADESCRKQMTEIIQATRTKLAALGENACCEELLVGNVILGKTNIESYLNKPTISNAYENTLLKLTDNALRQGINNPDQLFNALSGDLKNALMSEMGTAFGYDPGLFYGNASYDFIQSGGLDNLMGLVSDYIAAREEGERIAAEFRPKIQELVSKSAKYRLGEYLGLEKRPSVSNINRCTRIGSHIFIQFIGKTKILRYQNGRYEEIAEMDGNGLDWLYDRGKGLLYSSHLDAGIQVELESFSRKTLPPEDKKSISMKCAVMLHDGKRFVYPWLSGVKFGELGNPSFKSDLQAPRGYSHTSGIRFSSGSRYLSVAANASLNEDPNIPGGGIMLVDIEAGTLYDLITSAYCKVPIHCGVKQTDISPDGRFLAFSSGNTPVQKPTPVSLGVEACMAGSGNDAVHVYNISQKRVIRTLGEKSPAVLDVMFTRDSRLLLVLRNSIDRRLEVWDTESGKLLKIVSTSFQKFEVMEGMCKPKRQMSGQLFLSPDHKVLGVLGAVTNNASLRTADNSLEFFDFHEIMKDMVVSIGN